MLTTRCHITACLAGGPVTRINAPSHAGEISVRHCQAEPAGNYHYSTDSQPSKSTVAVTKGASVEL
jgi:hypothetical protein